MADSAVPPGSERASYVAQIHHLEEQAERLQQRFAGLETRNRDLTSQYDALEKDKAESVKHLQRCVDAKARKEAEQLQAQQLQLGLKMQGLQLQHDLQVQQLQQRQAALLSERQALATACLESQKLKEQQTQQIQEKLDSGTRIRQLVKDIKELQATIDGLKNQTESEREKTIAVRKKRVEKQVSLILREERAEDAECLQRLHFLQNRKVVLPKEMDALRDQNRDLCLQRDRLKADQRSLIKEGVTCKEVVKKTKMDCEQMEAELKDRSSALISILARTDALRRLVASTTEESRQAAAEAARLRAEMRRERRSRGGLEGVQWEGAVILHHILADSEEATETEQRLQRLLQILESSAPRV